MFFYSTSCGLSLLLAILPTTLALVIPNGSVASSERPDARDMLNFKESKKPIQLAQSFKATNLTIPLQIQCFYDPSHVEIDTDDCEKALFDVLDREDFLELYTFGPGGSYQGQMSWKKDRCEMAILPPTTKTNVEITLAELARYGLNVITRCRTERMELDLPNMGGQVVIPQTMGPPTQDRNLMVQMRNI